MGPNASRNTSVVALMAVFGLGICFVIVGAISEEYKAALGLSNADLGNLTLALFLTSSIVQFHPCSRATSSSPKPGMATMRSWPQRASLSALA